MNTVFSKTRRHYCSATHKEHSHQLLYTFSTRSEDLDPTLPQHTTSYYHTPIMKYTTICAAFFAAVAAASDVKQLNKDTFKSFVEENDLVLAECKSLA